MALWAVPIAVRAIAGVPDGSKRQGAGQKPAAFKKAVVLNSIAYES